jgi:hypothetical protein
MQMTPFCLQNTPFSGKSLIGLSSRNTCKILDFTFAESPTIP